MLIHVTIIHVLPAGKDDMARIVGVYSKFRNTFPTFVTISPAHTKSREDPAWGKARFTAPRWA